MDDKNKQKMKKNADITNHAKPRDITTGDIILFRQKKCNKLMTPFNPKPYTVVAVKGTMVTAKRQDHEITRNLSHFKLIGKYAVNDEQSIPRMRRQNQHNRIQYNKKFNHSGGIH